MSDSIRQLADKNWSGHETWNQSMTKHAETVTNFSIQGQSANLTAHLLQCVWWKHCNLHHKYKWWMAEYTIYTFSILTTYRFWASHYSRNKRWPKPLRPCVKGQIIREEPANDVTTEKASWIADLPHRKVLWSHRTATSLHGTSQTAS